MPNVVWNLVYGVVLIVLAPWLMGRAIRTGRYRRDLRAKLFPRRPARAADSQPHPAGDLAGSAAGTERPTVWFHGVSVGEVHLLVTLVRAFRQRHPDWKCLVSSTTDTGLAEARSRLNDCTVTPWPFDFSWAVRAALDTHQPRLVVLAETELWPNFLAEAQRRRIPVALINARLSPRSARRFGYIRGLTRRIFFQRLACVAAQTPEYAERFTQLGASHVTVTGSIKYDGAVGDRDTPKGRELRRLLNPGEARILVAGSTHAPEEAYVLRLMAALQQRFPQLRLIVVPRHPDRFEEVAKLIAAEGWSFVRRSTLTEPLPMMPPVVLLDTIGELGAAWGLADVGYVGGTLDGVRGGQSMIEPAGYGVPTVFGPHVWNFRDAARLLVEAGGAIMVNQPDELTPAFAELLNNSPLRQQMGQRAQQLVWQQQGATARTLDVLDQLIRTAPQPHGG